MKKMICLLLVMLLLCGCGKNEDEIEMPVNFYYLNTEIYYNSHDGVLSPEVRDRNGYSENLTGLLDLYFKGPLSHGFLSPFPAGTTAKQAFLEDEILNVELSKSFAQLKGLDLTLACACLVKTVSELTECNAVCIYVADTMLDGNPSVTVNVSDLLLLDEVI